MSTVVLVLLIALGAIVFAGGLTWLLLRVARRVTADAAADPSVAGAVQVQPAVLRGAHNAGTSVMGNGVLALQRDRLVFVLGTPRRVLDIPLSAITDVEVTNTLRMPGRYSKGARLFLVVRANTPDGEAVLGWIVANPAGWAQAIKPGTWRDSAGTSR